MAEVTAMRNNALPYPIRGESFTVTFPILDADGDLVSGATGLDSEISKNGDTFADCTNEATEIATNSGIYYLTLTTTEMTTDVATIIVKTSSVGAKTTVLTLYPRKTVLINSGTAASGGVATDTLVLESGASAVNDFYNGMYAVAVIDGTRETRIITDYVGSTKTATVSPDWTAAPDSDDTYSIRIEGVQFVNSNLSAIGSAAVSTTTAQLGVNAVQAGATAWGSGAITAASIASDAITAAKIADGAIDANTFAASAITASAIAADAITAAKIADGAIDAGTFAAGAITASAIAADAIGASELAADAVTEIQSGLATAADLSTLQTTATAIEADTQDIQSRIPAALVSGRIDASAGAIAANAITATAIAADAITAAKIADGAIDAATFAAGAITSTVVATGAIDADALATDAVTEITNAIAALVGADPTAVPAPTATWLELLSWLAAQSLNAKTCDRSTGNTVVYANDGTSDGGTPIASMVVADDGTETSFTAWE